LDFVNFGGFGGFRFLDPPVRERSMAMGKMRNCGMWNAESKKWNEKCGMTLIGRVDKPRDR